jgi:hypothetical protein
MTPQSASFAQNPGQLQLTTSMERTTKPRSRILNFRVTEEEYRQVRRASAGIGCRGISDFARETILERARRAADPELLPALNAPTEGPIGLERRIASLQSAIGVLSDRLKEAAAAAATGSNEGRP